jgi:radical SAM protein with 4Fe4S-binding SPASM domain
MADLKKAEKYQFYSRMYPFYSTFYLSKKYSIKTYQQPLMNTVTLWHDEIKYTWRDVPDKKYRNWIKVKNHNVDKDDFFAEGFPYVLQIEPTSLCNLACPLCPAGRNELERERRHMTFQEFKSIVDDMEDYLLFLIMWDWGEPLMNPQLPEMIQYSHDKGIQTVTSTNGHFFTNEAYLEDLLTSGLTTLIIAVDSISKENYEIYRKKGQLNKVLEGLQELIVIKNRIDSKTIINMRMVIMKQNEHEIGLMRNLAKDLGVDVFTVKTVNPSCGPISMDMEIVPENPKFRRYLYHSGTYQRIRTGLKCERIWDMSNIFSNGDVVPCCYDYNSEMKIGNIGNQKFSEIWNSDAYRDLRKKIFYNQDSLPKCSVCGCNYQLSSNGWFVESINFNKRNIFLEKMHKIRKFGYNRIIPWSKRLCNRYW